VDFSSSYANCSLGFGIIPRNIELCIDARSAGSIDDCDPNLTSAPNGIPIYSPVKGCMFFTAGKNLVIEFSPTGDTYLDNCSSGSIIGRTLDRFQVTFTHLKATYTTQAWTKVEAGQLVGHMCLESEWNNLHPYCPGPAGLDPLVPQHLAVHLFKARTGYISDPLIELPLDVRAFLSRPHCLFDTWKYTNGGTPSVQTPPSSPPNQKLAACP
jgi:hypothetical protein